MSASLADKEYREAVEAFDAGDMQSFLDHFFIAIHQRYDIENPVIKRFIRKKLDIINQLRREKEVLTAEFKKKERYLKKLSAEYVMMGKECERENMKDAAIANYKKALELHPGSREAKRRLQELSGR